MTDIIWKSTIDWHAGNVGCKIVRYSQGVVTYASTYALVALSLDRLHAIARPLGFSGKSVHSVQLSHFKGLRIRLLVGLAWMFALLFSIPMLIITEARVINGRMQCWVDFPQPWIWKLYITTIAVILFFIPAIIIAVCYIIIVVIIWSKSALNVGEIPNSSGTRLIKNGGHIYVAANNRHFKDSATSSRGLIPKAKMKTIKMTLVIVLVFVICWSPFFVFDLLDVYGFIEQSQESVALSTFIQSLAPLNSAANPIIYASFNTKMCVNLFQRKGKRHQSPTSYNSHMSTNTRTTVN
ncbi:hypothetical protein C0Q70_00714 [Pomacea canaliculata]|uniref:G-protein coupled receptors family 1 profile domain-containing protein n=1 Tax=Pomacea canaliculata TaxID=400727 RepID=A0A2T7PXE5_POMCA|nr:hypothetical protein C0Q70_00714 [Pomacea canaliculata]